MASLLAGAFPAMGAQASAYGVHGFNAQGQLVYRVVYELPGAKEDSLFTFVVVADAKGDPVREAALENDDQNRTNAAGQALVAQAEPRAAAEALVKDLPEPKPSELDAVFTSSSGAKLSFSESERGGDCVLLATWTTPSRTVTGEILRDRPPPHPAATMALHACAESKVSVAFRADGARAALAWNLKDDVDPDRAHLAYVSPQDLASIEILDAGAGKARVSEFSAAATGAGFRVALSAKARAKRTASAVYARKGFELEAAQVAKLAGADSVALLDWDSCCAIAVALAK